MSLYIDSKWGAGFPRWERARVYALMHPNTSHAKLYKKRVAAALEATNGSNSYDGKSFDFLHDGWKGNAGQIKYRVCSPFCAAMQIQMEFHHSDPMVIGEMLHSAVYGGYFVHDYSTQKHMLRLRERLTPLQTKTVKCRACWKQITRKGEVLPRVDSNSVLEELWAKEKQFLQPSGLTINPAFAGEHTGMQPMTSAPLPPLLGTVAPKQEFPAFLAEAAAQSPNLVAIDEDGNMTELHNLCIVPLSDKELYAVKLLTPEARRIFGEQYTLKFQP